MSHTNQLYELATKLMHGQNKARKDIEEADEESESLDSQIKTVIQEPRDFQL